MPEYTWISDDIFTVAGFLSPEECRRYIDFSENAGYAAAPINGWFGPVMDQSIRNNTRVIIDSPDHAAELWRRAEPFVPAMLDGRPAVGVNERLRFYRYTVGQKFDWHRDGAFERRTGEKSRLTFMIYLNDGFEGGETRFEDHAVVPAAGTALFFVHRLLHQGAPVRAGCKYVLRTDVMYGKG